MNPVESLVLAVKRIAPAIAEGGRPELATAMLHRAEDAERFELLRTALHEPEQEGVCQKPGCGRPLEQLPHGGRPRRYCPAHSPRKTPRKTPRTEG